MKDHRYDYIETGSLLSIKKNTKGIVIPSEETRLTMYPMDLEEFRWALGDELTIPLLQDVWAQRRTNHLAASIYDWIAVVDRTINRSRMGD